MSEIIFVLLLAGGMLGSGIVMWRKTGHWQLLAVFGTFFLCFGLWEWQAVSSTGMSISQQVWAYGESNPLAFWITIGALIIAWLALMWHFIIKKLGRK